MTQSDSQPQTPQRVVFVTGPSGAGRSTAINALEDLGFEAIDNLPLSLLPRLLTGPRMDRPIALGIDARNRDYSPDVVLQMFETLDRDPMVDPELLYIDCRADVLRHRYSETRRRHPLTPDADPADGIALELAMLGPIKARATTLINSSDLTPHQLRAEMGRLFAAPTEDRLSVTVTSFSYRKGVPPNADLVFDCRFLRNPHWDADLRAQDGQDAAVQAYVAQDARFDPFRMQVIGLLDLLLPAFEDEGKTHLTVAFGCTGGKHRSVTLTENIAAHLAKSGWQVSKRHRELKQ